MKIVTFVLFLCIIVGPVFGQEWRAQLNEARKSFLNKSYEKSYKEYRSAQKMAPKGIDLSDEMGQAAYKAGKFEEAEKIFEQSSSNKGNAIQKGIVQRQIGNSKMQQKKYSEAAESFKESLRNNPNDQKSRYNLSQAMKKAKEQKEQQQKQGQGDKSDSKSDPNQKPKDNQPSDKKNQQVSKDMKPAQNGQQPQDANNQSKLSDKKTERMLDDLVKKEMETKKKFDGVKSSGSGVKRTGKDW